MAASNDVTEEALAMLDLRAVARAAQKLWDQSTVDPLLSERSAPVALWVDLDRALHPTRLPGQ